MMTKVEIPQELRYRHEHTAWLEDYARWHAEHREALMLLAKVQTAILERDAELARQAAEIRAHTKELEEFDLIGTGEFAPDPDKQLSAHEEFSRKHQRAREVYGVTKQRHLNVVAEIKKLSAMCG